LRFFFVRAAAGSLAVGSAAPVNLPFEMQTVQIAASADAGKPVRPAGATHQAPQRGDVEIADGGDLRGEARLLKISAKGDLPCDSGDWATSPLFGPHAGLAAALGVKPGHAQSGARDTALADALDNRPATGDADSSAFGSVFGNAGQPSIGGPGGGLFTTGGSTDTSGGGSVIVGGGTGSGAGAGTGTGKGGGATNGGGTTNGGGAASGGGPDKGGTGPNGGGIDAGSAGGTTPDGGVGSGGGTGPTGGGTGSTGNPDGGDISPIIPNQPINPGSGDHSGDASDGGSNGDGNMIDPSAPGAVPEPSSWATMLVGFGLIGGLMRRRRLCALPDPQRDKASAR
jgi:hypothetical protein